MNDNKKFTRYCNCGGSTSVYCSGGTSCRGVFNNDSDAEKNKTAVNWLIANLSNDVVLKNAEVLRQAIIIEIDQHKTTWDVSKKTILDMDKFVVGSYCHFNDYYTKTYGDDTNITDVSVQNDVIKSDWDIEKFFEALRFNEKTHLGLGDIRLTIGAQEEVCELVKRFYRKK